MTKNVNHAIDAFRNIITKAQIAHTKLIENKQFQSETFLRYIETSIEDIEANLAVLKWVYKYQKANVDFDVEIKEKTDE